MVSTCLAAAPLAARWLISLSPMVVERGPFMASLPPAPAPGRGHRSPSAPAVWPMRGCEHSAEQDHPWPFIPLPGGRMARATARPSGHDRGAAPADGLAETSQGMERVTVAVAHKPHRRKTELSAPPAGPPA